MNGEKIMPDQKEDWIDSDELRHLFAGLYSSANASSAKSFMDEIRDLIRDKRGENMKDSWGEALASDQNYPYKTGPKWQSFEEFFEEFKKREGME